MNNINSVNAYRKAIELPQNKQVKENKVVDGKNTDAEKVAKETVLYEKNTDYEGLTTYNRKGRPLDPEAINKLKEEAEMHYSNMIETIRNMITKQATESGTKISDEFYLSFQKTEIAIVADRLNDENDGEIGNLDDPNNYWSAEQTSDRIVEFAKQISGGDVSKYERLKEAIEKGFEAAYGYFDEMPEITGKTHELIMQKLDEWAGKIESEKDDESKVDESQAIFEA